MSMNSGPVYLHAGAHRTGTSSFQMCLHANRAQLRSLGFDLAYPGRDGIPSGELALRLPGPRHGKADMKGFENKGIRHFANLQTSPGVPLILSEENIPGRMFHFFKGQFYPAAEQRLRVLRTALGDRPIKRLVFVLRRYDELFVSAFRKRAEDNPVPVFADLVPNMIRMDRGWAEIVELMRDILTPETFVVLRYETRGSSLNLLHRLVPDVEMCVLKEPARTMNLSATDTALQILQNTYQKGEKLSRAQWQDVIKTHSDNVNPLGFAEFAREQSEYLHGRYLHDLERISEMSDISFTR